jgi:hypothetical protein
MLMDVSGQVALVQLKSLRSHLPQQRHHQKTVRPQRSLQFSLINAPLLQERDSAKMLMDVGGPVGFASNQIIKLFEFS